MKHILPLTLAATISLLIGCSSGNSGSSAGNPAAVTNRAEPRLLTDMASLDAALKCTAFTHPENPPVLLVHGTGTAGFEQYDWTYIPLLSSLGFDVCAVTYPDRGLIDMQVSAEYVVHALRRIHELTGRKVAMIGHSQGASMPRWALKFWPSARDAVEDFVLLAGPNHGTQVAALSDLLAGIGLPGQMPAALYQFSTQSDFVAAVNRGDETPGEIDYTSIYTLFDELVQPAVPVATAALDRGQDNPRVSNILLQDVCPGHLADHLTIGLTDRLAFELTLDAIRNPGPASVARAGGASGLCGFLPIIPDQVVAPEAATALVGILRQSAEAGLPDLHLTNEEPPLREYALQP